MLVNKIFILSMLTIPVNNAQNERGKNERKSSDKGNGDDCG